MYKNALKLFPKLEEKQFGGKDTNEKWPNIFTLWTHLYITAYTMQRESESFE
jgi:hypothetical protein